MAHQNNKPNNDLGLFSGTHSPANSDRNHSKYDNSGKRENKRPEKSEHKKGDIGNQVPANIGWLYYKDYYHGIDFQPRQSKDIFKEKFEEKNKAITSRRLSQYAHEVEASVLNFDTVQSFELTTEYPGLVTGLGSPHESHKDGEYKLGFYFDHTTGLPVIPGSSVKGVLRSAFKKSREYIKEITGKDISDIEALEKEIFDREGVSIYKRDIFLDAVIISSADNNKKFLADDFITPHPHAFREPNPIQFLKVRSQVTFRFQFRLNDGVIKAEEKKKLFERILTDLGIGAKTNVGYGKFVDSSQLKAAGGCLAEVKRLRG